MAAHRSLDDLAAFAAVARAGSFTRASASLGTSTSNLSHTIRRLEARLGIRLLERNSRGVSPTTAGTALLATLGPALDNIEGALATLADGRERIGGLLRLTATREGYAAVIRPALPRFLAAHPDAEVEVAVEYGFRDLVADGFDAGVRIGEKLDGDTVALRVGPALRMAVVASPSYLARHGTPVHPAELRAHHCVNQRLASAGTVYAWEFERDGAPFSVRVPARLTVSEPAMSLEAALDGLGIACVFEPMATAHLRAGALVRLLEEWTPPFPGFFVYHSSRRQVRPVLSAFLDALRRARGGAPAEDASARAY